MEYGLREKRALGGLINIQRSLPPSLRKVPLAKQEMKLSRKEGCVDEQGAPS